MSLNLNHVTLAGRLTRDPELRPLNGDQAVVNFGLAINRRWKDKLSGETKEDATFLDCEAWGKTAQLIQQYLHKGSSCYLEGRLKLDQWQDPQGQTRTKVKVVVANVQFLDGKPQVEGAEGDLDHGEDAGATSAPRSERPSPSPRSATNPRPRTQVPAASMADEPPF